ncbi:hypothetical protein [Phormidium nigroviride]|nr:hypothetical protein [Oscillatoria nigro-viridis]
MTIVVSSICLELHDFWEQVLPIPDARQKTRFTALVRASECLLSAPY